MAIYKPSNCTPFLTCLDLTKAQDITCELNTSNELVTGYKIKILDSNNDVIFEGAKFDPINPVGYENSGLNGSTLVLPLIVEGKAINNNTIGYQNGGYNVKDPTGTKFDATRFSNGYINQPYKWEIVLEQGNTTGVKADKFYDMTITQGKVLGSTRNRIQSYLSDNIYKDYFIQLNNTSKRVLINSYDHTYGYLYPQENKFTDEEVKAATYFEIYKFSNDPDVIAAGSQVAYAINKPMKEVKIGGKQNTMGWGSNLVYPYYFEQVFKGLSNSYATQNDIPNSAFNSEMSGFLVIGTNVMVKGESEGTNAFNGIFTLNSVSEKEQEVEVDGKKEKQYDLTLKWLRSTPGNTWANLTNTVFYVQNGTDKGRWQVNTDTQTVGTINQTPVIFIREKPVEIYTDASKGYSSDKTKGQIFKNTIRQVYIRPFIGIESGMRFSYLKKGEIAYKNINDFTIDTETWQLSGNIGEILKPDETQYKISSYFKRGDENPFYAYAKPVVVLFCDGEVLSSDDLNRTIIYRRIANLSAEFQQENNKSWTSFQWYLNDLTDGTTIETDKFYTGNISYEFDGLQDGHIYQAILRIEDEFGNTYDFYGNIEANISIISGKTDLNIEQDCVTQSYLINFTKDGVVIPKYDPQTLGYRVIGDNITSKENYTVKEENAETYEPFAITDIGAYGYNIEYPETASGETYLSLSNIEHLEDFDDRESLMEYDQINITNSEIYTPIATPAGNANTFNSQHKLNAGFVGDIIKYEMDVDDVLFKDTKAIVRIYLPPLTRTNDAGEIELYTNDSNDLYVQYEVKSLEQTNGMDYTVVKTPDDEELFFVKDNDFIVGRYSVIATYTRVYYSGSNGIIFAAKAIPWDAERAQNAKVVSAWVEPGTTADEKCDYIDTDIVYDVEPNNANYRHIRGEGKFNSHGLIHFPFTTLQKETGHPSFFYDKKNALVTQANDAQNNENKINVLTGEYNYIDDGHPESPNYWQDNVSEAEVYAQTNINNNGIHNGRQFVANKILTMNLALRNYNSNSRSDPTFASRDFEFNLFTKEV